MSRFFRRIFLSVWIIMSATAALTLFTLTLFPQAEEVEPFDKQLIALVANDLRDALNTDPVGAFEYVQKHHVLDLNSLMQIYLLDPSGADVYGRRLPAVVSRMLGQTGKITAAPLNLVDPRILTISEGLAGYQVVGYQTAYPIGRVLARPGARLFMFVVALLVSGIVSYVLARFIVLPIRRLREAGRLVEAGDLRVRVAHTVGNRTDDIAELARGFDSMTARIDQLLSNQQRLMRDVSHELRSPLARLQALLSIARQKNEDNEMVDRMERETERLNQLIEQILTYARLDTQSENGTQLIDVVDLLKTISEDAVIEGSAERKAVVVHGAEKIMMSANNALLHSVFENIIRNGVRHTGPGTDVSIYVKDLGSTVSVSIRDCGTGVPEESLAQLFEPFYQVDEGRSREGGSGVGLAIAERGINLHHGRIWAENQPNGGLSINIELPKDEQ